MSINSILGGQPSMVRPMMNNPVGGGAPGNVPNGQGAGVTQSQTGLQFASSLGGDFLGIGTRSPLDHLQLGFPTGNAGTPAPNPFAGTTNANTTPASPTNAFAQLSASLPPLQMTTPPASAAARNSAASSLFRLPTQQELQRATEERPEPRSRMGLGEVAAGILDPLGIVGGVGSIVGGVAQGVGSVVGGVAKGVGKVVGGVAKGIGKVAKGVGKFFKKIF